MVNLGPFFTWWDRLAGTWVSPEVPAPDAYGPAEPSSRNPIRIELAGWATLLRAQSWRPRRAPANTATWHTTTANGTRTLMSKFPRST